MEKKIDLEKIRPAKPKGLSRAGKYTPGESLPTSPEASLDKRATPGVMGEKKATFGMLFASLAILLVLLPFVTTFNELLTRIVENTGAYKLIQIYIVPVLTRAVAIVLRPFGIEVAATKVGLIVNGASVRLSWNCLGWQSLILFFISLLTGLQGPYTRLSKIECVLTGILGTFFVNLLRISGVVLMSTYVSRLAAIIFHDYGTNILIIVWLFFFWWYSFNFVLERQNGEGELT